MSTSQERGSGDSIYPNNLMGANTSRISEFNNPNPMERDDSRSTRLTGRTLTIARLVWISLSLLVAGLYIWTISSLGFSVKDFPYIVLMPLGYFAISLVIFWRKSNDLMGLLTSLMLIFLVPT